MSLVSSVSFLLFSFSMSHYSASGQTVWPVLTSYEGRYLRRVALPLGGIGTGTISLGGRGDLRDWEVMNRPAKGFVPGLRIWGTTKMAPFFALRTQTTTGVTQTRCLEGPIPPEDYEGSHGTPVHGFPGLPRFTQARFNCSYPLAQVHLEDEAVPLQVRLESFNPLVPGDADASSLPLAVMRWVLTNPTHAPIQAAIAASVPNFVGRGSLETAQRDVKGRNQLRDDALLSGLLMDAPDLWALDAENGSLALAIVRENGLDISRQERWFNRPWYGGLTDFWNDFSADGSLEESKATDEESTGGDTNGLPVASLAARCEIAPGESRALTFLLSWHFPNRKIWWPKAVGSHSVDPGTDHDPDQVGNFYTMRFADAWESAQHGAARLDDLEERTVRFVTAFCEADFPAEVKEAALYNLSTLRSQTTFQTADGFLMGWEGCWDDRGSCEGSCTHVWNYENALGFLWGDLSRSMREVEFLHATDDTGLMSFRVDLPLAQAQHRHIAAADGQMGAIMRLYRDWKLCGDEAWLEKLWPQAKKALEFCWLPGGWDADCDGVMEGCQHNTMDVEYFGPNPLMGFWYLGALRASEEMARHRNETAFAARCRRLYQSGRVWLDTHLFNGEYYEQEVRPIASSHDVLSGLLVDAAPQTGKPCPDFQIGAGCLVDQLTGQYMAHVCDLGYLGDPQNIRVTLQSILKYNGQGAMHDHFNHMRTFALDDESALVMCSFPQGKRPRFPFPNHSEVMTGFEYTVAAGAMYEGQSEAGLKVIRDIRARYDGLKRSPFNEAECGHHYARALASWTAILALSGFHYCALEKTLKFNASPQPCRWFWSNGAAWGTFEQNADAVTLSVLSGSLELRALRVGEQSFDFAPIQLEAGRTHRIPRYHSSNVSLNDALNSSVNPSAITNRATTREK